MPSFGSVILAGTTRGVSPKSGHAGRWPVAGGRWPVAGGRWPVAGAFRETNPFWDTGAHLGFVETPRLNRGDTTPPPVCTLVVGFHEHPTSQGMFMKEHAEFS